MYAHGRLKSACAFAQWSEFSLSTRTNLASLAIQNAPSEDSDQSDLNLRSAHMS